MTIQSLEFDSIFTCSCGQALPVLEPLPDWAHWFAFPSAGWSVEHNPSVREYFERIERLPEPGTIHSLVVDEHFGLPKVGGSVWVLFEPPNTAINGWDDNPEEIANSGLVRIELVEIQAKYDREAVLSVRVLETRSIHEIYSLFPPCVTPAPLQSLMCDGAIQVIQWGDLACSISTEDDGHAWTICQRNAGAWSLLMHSRWCYHSDVIHVGHRLLSADESSELGLPDAGK